jgi:hypothetical protein
VTITKQDVEAAARAAYAEVVKRAPKHYNDPAVLARYKPWDELSDSWREDFTAVQEAGLTAALAAMREYEEAMSETVYFDDPTQDALAKIGIWVDGGGVEFTVKDAELLLNSLTAKDREIAQLQEALDAALKNKGDPK